MTALNYWVGAEGAEFPVRIRGKSIVLSIKKLCENEECKVSAAPGGASETPWPAEPITSWNPQPILLLHPSFPVVSVRETFISGEAFWKREISSSSWKLQE